MHRFIFVVVFIFEVLFIFEVILIFEVIFIFKVVFIFEVIFKLRSSSYLKVIKNSLEWHLGTIQSGVGWVGVGVGKHVVIKLSQLN